MVDYDKTNYNKNPEEVKDKLLTNKASENEVRENEEFIDSKIFLALYERRLGLWVFFISCIGLYYFMYIELKLKYILITK